MNYYARKRIGHAAKHLLGMKYIPVRYAPMYSDIRQLRPRTVLEIGTNDGLNAVRMMKLTIGKYYGFDLFESLDDETCARESALHPPSRADVEAHLKRNGLSYQLFAGDTTKTLPSADLPQMDLIFIDGGHSEETVQADWDICRGLMHDKTVVYFDDYPNFGIKAVVDRIDGYRVEIMPEHDVFDGKAYHLARVNKC